MSNQQIVDKYVTLYHAEWCGHCKTFKPEWDKFKAAYEKSKEDIKNKYKINLIIKDYEADANPKEIEEAQVAGFPTVIIKYNGKKEDYNGARKAESLFEYLIPSATPNEIQSWINKGQSGGNSQINLSDPKIIYADSYRKMMKYRNKCIELGLCTN